MATSFLKSYDDILQNILTAYSNLDPSPDTTIGSVVYIKASTLASTIWGLYKYQDYLANQQFILSSDSYNLNNHGADLGLSKLSSDTDETYRQKILDFIRQPPAGGNALDFKNWAESQILTYNGTKYWSAQTTVSTPDNAHSYVTPGNVLITIVPNDETILSNPTSSPCSDLVALIQSYIDTVRPVTASSCVVVPTTITNINVAVTLSYPTGADVAAIRNIIKSDIKAYFTNLKPGDQAFLSKITAICVQDGADNVLSLAMSGATVGDQPANPYTTYRMGSDPSVN